MLSGDKREESVTGKHRTAQFLLKYYEVDQSNQDERWSVCVTGKGDVKRGVKYSI
jgi:hypothetical protein